jgi:hypothetical protein
LAHEQDGEILVAYALPTGPEAERGPGHLRTDATFQNSALERLRQHCPQLAYVGDWHVHPMWMPYLSTTDRQTAGLILREDGAHRDRLLLLLGTMPPRGMPVIVGFVARLLPVSRDLEVREVDLQIVADDSTEVRGHLGHPLEALGLLLKKPVVEVAIEHPSSARIAADLQDIRRDLHADTDLRSSEDLISVIVRRGRQEAVIVFPPEYPLGAPQVFSGSLDEGPLIPVPLLYGWSSIHRLVDLVDDALEPDSVAPLPRGAAPGPARPSSLFDALLGWMVQSRPPATPTQGKEPPS